MSLNIPRELAKERVIASYKQDRNIARAAREGGVAYATANAWLAKAGLVHSDLVTPKHDSGMNRNVIKGPDPRNVARVDRDPCPRCNTRKDIGCKHFPKQPEAQRPMTERATPAPPIFPFPDHRTVAQIDSLIRCQTCGDDVDPSDKGFCCTSRACPINREPLW